MTKHDPINLLACLLLFLAVGPLAAQTNQPPPTVQPPLTATPPAMVVPTPLEPPAVTPPAAAPLRVPPVAPVPVPLPVPPAPMREFRGVWVSTVVNIDWPSKPGLTTDQQKAEMVALLDRAARLHFNAVLLQVRPSADALYPSTLEPWSEYLTGKMGQAPAPFYDPLAFAVAEAHKRGLELHAWFNPFRVRHPSARSAPSASSVSRTHPQWVRSYGHGQWLDPGDPAARDYSLSVILDVVQRYDIDGVHLDDYFYPYPEYDSHGRLIDFPDDSAWSHYRHTGGRASRGDWRRGNINDFVKKLYAGVKHLKPWVKVGISPFGIYRPHQPAQIKGFDAYSLLYADSRKWLREGWVDYLAPQLYWKIEQTPQSFPVLLQWWASQNPKNRCLWPGLFTSSVGRSGSAWPPSEIVYQIKTTRGAEGATGNIHFSMAPLHEDRAGIDEALLDGVYATPALVPAFPWLETAPPLPPSVLIQSDPLSGTRMLTWAAALNSPAQIWVVQSHAGGRWTTRLLPAAQSVLLLSGADPAPDAVAVSAVDRCGLQSAPTLLRL